MRKSTLIHLALAWAVLGVSLARAEKLLIERRAPAPANAPAEKMPPSDAAEPPVKVEATLSSDTGGRALQNNTSAVEVSNSAAGTKLRLTTQGGYSGTAKLAFKSSAPPMRFTMTLTRMPQVDLSSLSLTSGSVTLQVGAVGTSATTKHYDAKGREQATANAAAYTILAKRGANGDVDIQVRRGAGAELGKAFQLSWQSDYGARRLGGARLILDR